MRCWAPTDQGQCLVLDQSPNTRGVVQAKRSEQATIMTEGDKRNSPSVRLERAQELSGYHVPQSDVAAVSSRYEQTPIRAESRAHAADQLKCLLEFVSELTTAHVPQSSRYTTRSRESTPVWVEHRIPSHVGECPQELAGLYAPQPHGIRVMPPGRNHTTVGAESPDLSLQGFRSKSPKCVFKNHAKKWVERVFHRRVEPRWVMERSKLAQWSRWRTQQVRCATRRVPCGAPNAKRAAMPGVQRGATPVTWRARRTRLPHVRQRPTPHRV